ncbi:DUF3572 domain-containing protein [Sulfitobacter albidus]|uniref:DUF3572 domain-containing protein n=1 Tax=Sulfitobacter albidus TaxID=2829501 RepID=A0A975JB76_9RHOB|nr:DUF3572 domain-containing protein [Sulfitobacter albidus]QUJ75233.1 DUF3572 domain-containing protein [Sulfitobacter albidus]
MTLSSDTAEAIALQTLGWLVGNEDLLPVFLGASGCSEAELRARLNDPSFQGAVLDFLLMDDAWVLACAEATQTPPDRFAQARQVLPGGQDVSWT